MYRQLAEQYFKQELKACEGVIETLSQIDLAMGVASNGPLAKMQLALSVTDLAIFFGNNLFSAYDVGSWKPEPGLFLHAAEALGYAPQECLVVEDSIVGIQAAKAAGMHFRLYDPNRIHASVGDVYTN